MGWERERERGRRRSNGFNLNGAWELPCSLSIVAGMVEISV